MKHALNRLKNWLTQPSIPSLISNSSIINPIDDEYNKLDERVRQLKITFIDALSTTSLRPSAQDEEFAKAFVLLFHASLEDYFEKIAILLSRRYIKKYRDTDFVTTSDLSDITLLNQKIKSQIETYLMIVSYAAFERSSGKEKITEEFELLHKDLKDMEAKDAITTDSFKSFKTISGYVKKILERSSNILFKSFGEQNHGASLKYMAPILLSIGIDVNTDLRLQNSLRLMAYYRGDYAHLGQNSMISRIMSQTDLIDYMSDCLILCEEIKVKASMKYN